MTTRSSQSAATRATHPLSIGTTDAFQRALKLHQQGKLKEAEAGYEGVLQREPGHIQASYLLGLIGSQTSRPQMAIERIGQYLKFQPNDHQALSILGLAHYDLGEYAICAALLERGLQLYSNSPHTYFNLGKTRFAMKEFEEAITAHERALTLEPTYIEAMIGKANAERELRRHEAALATLETAILQDPLRPELHFYYGNSMRDLHEWDAAIDAYGAAVTLMPDYLDAWVNLATTYKDMDRLSEAIDAYDRALAITPEHPEANYNKSLALLSDLQLDKGWSLYEKRLSSETSVRKFIGGQRIQLAPDWDGQSRPDSLLVIGEQGLGDQIFFSSMLADLQAQQPGSAVCVEPRLVPLLQRSLPGLRFIDGSQIQDQTYDAQVYLGSLGKLYRPDHASMERVRPYLKAAPQRRAELRRRIKQDGRLVCGLSWVSKNQEFGAGKSLDLHSLLPALAVSGIDFIDLQYGDTRDERHDLEAKHGIHITHLDDVDCTNDIDDLAALVDACDIVLTVSNTTAHLACALGKPTIVMLPDSPARFWYWHAHGLKSPWYPSACLFRKSDAAHWTPVIDAVALTLAGIC